MLTDKARDLISAANYGMVSTVLPDGHIQTQPVWVDTDGEYVFINTERLRQKHKNIENNPTITVTVVDENNHYHWVEVRGTVVETVGGDEGRGHIDQLAKKYMGVDDYPNPIASERMKVKIAPDRVLTFPPS